MSLANVKPDIDVSYYIHSTHIISLADVLTQRLIELHRAAGISGNTPRHLKTYTEVIRYLKVSCIDHVVYTIDTSKIRPACIATAELRNMESALIVHRYKVIANKLAAYLSIIEHTLETEGKCNVADAERLIVHSQRMFVNVIDECWNSDNTPVLITHMRPYI